MRLQTALLLALTACGGGGASQHVGPAIERAIIDVHEHCAEPACDALVERLLATRVADERGALSAEQRLRVFAALRTAPQLTLGKIDPMKTEALLPPSDDEDALGRLQERLTERAQQEAERFSRWKQPEDLQGRLTARGWVSEPCVVDMFGPIACEVTQSEQRVRVILRKHDTEDEARRYEATPDLPGATVTRDERYTLTAVPLKGEPDGRALLQCLTAARPTW